MYCDNRLKTPALLANDNRCFKDMDTYYDEWLAQYRMWVVEFDRVDEELSNAQAAPVLDPNLLPLTVRHRALHVVLVDIRGILRNLDPDRFHSEFETHDVHSTELDSSDSAFDPTDYGS